MPDSPFPDDVLVDKALHALIEFMRGHKDGPVTGREAALVRFVLAFLYRGGDRAPFDAFYRAAVSGSDGTDAREFGRFQTMRSAFAAISRQHKRDYW